MSLVREGALVLASGRRENRLRALRNELHRQRVPGAIAIKRGDVLDHASIDELFTTAVALWGGLDCVVYSAGVYASGTFACDSFEQWESTFGTNHLGFLYVVTDVVNKIPNRPVHVFAFTSSLSRSLKAQCLAYSLSKNALEQCISRAGRVTARNGVFLHAIDPGPFRSEMNPSCNLSAAAAASVVASKVSRHFETRRSQAWRRRGNCAHTPQ
jgi:NAD(P)-dependent dehydrogenase (short-subunit alcohol dehydrogenase family)